MISPSWLGRSRRVLGIVARGHRRFHAAAAVRLSDAATWRVGERGAAGVATPQRGDVSGSTVTGWFLEWLFTHGQ